MPDPPCPTCGEPIELTITWLQDSDGDEIRTRSWWYPELASEARCLACGAEPDADTLDAWMDEIGQAGWPGPPESIDYGPPDDIPW